jgi:hypothetical protein
MSEKDHAIQEREKKVFDLKKRNQELEKYKFVLDFRIKDLKQQVEPKEDKIVEMGQTIEVLKRLTL